MLHTYHMHLNTALIRRTSGRCLGTSKCNGLLDMGKHLTKYTAYCLTRINYAFQLSFTSYLYTTSHHGVPLPRCSTVFSNFMSSCYIEVQRPGYCKRPCGHLNVSSWRSITRLHASKFGVLTYYHKIYACTYSVRLTANSYHFAERH